MRFPYSMLLLFTNLWNLYASPNNRIEEFDS